MSGKLSLLLMFSLLFQSCSTNEDVIISPNNNVVFIDEFETFDTAVWNKEAHEAGWTNNELQIYDTNQVSVGIDDGKSVLMLTAERIGDRIISGRINSQGKKTFKYGRIEASIKLPNLANGLWPAFWMMGDNDKSWPACGEIDIMEMGSQEAIAAGKVESTMNAAIHYGTDVDGHRQEYYMKDVTINLQDGNYHVYALERNEYSLDVFVDDIKFYSFDVSKVSGRYDFFQDEFFILFNLAVGGNFTGIYNIDEITALKDGEKATMYIDWIKIFN